MLETKWVYRGNAMKKTDLAPNQTRIGQGEIRFLAEKVQRLTFKHLIETTTIDRPEAMQIAARAADQYANELERSTADYTGRLIPFPSKSEAMQWWMREVKDRPVSVLVDEPEFRAACPYGVRRTIDRKNGGWTIRHA